MCYPTSSYTCDTYTRTPGQIQKLQACLNRSLSSTLHVYGHATALLAEVGIPPLHITHNLQLAQFRYGLSTNKKKIIPHTLYVREQHARAIMRDYTMGRRMQKAIRQVDRDRIDPHTPMPPSVQQAKRAHVHWHLSSDTLGRNLHRPAPYLTHQNAKYQLEMLRIRTQSWIDYIPSHLHYQRGPGDLTKIGCAHCAYLPLDSNLETKST